MPIFIIFQSLLTVAPCSKAATVMLFRHANIMSKVAGFTAPGYLSIFGVGDDVKQLLLNTGVLQYFQRMMHCILPRNRAARTTHSLDKFVSPLSPLNVFVGYRRRVREVCRDTGEGEGRGGQADTDGCSCGEGRAGFRRDSTA